MSLDENLKNKHAGDLIRSEDWNALASETARLDAAKLNGQLIGIQMLHAVNWENATTLGDWQMVVKETVTCETATSFLLVGQGHGLSDTANVALDVAFRVNGTILGQEPVGGIPWGVGLIHPSASGANNWIQVMTIAQCQVPSGSRLVELVMRCRRNGGTTGTVKFNAPTLWLIRLGAS